MFAAAYVSQPSRTNIRKHATRCGARSLPSCIMVRATDTTTDAFRQKVRNNLTKLLMPSSTRTSLSDIVSIQHTEKMKDLTQLVDICSQDSARITQVKRLAEQKAATISPSKRQASDNEPWPAQYTTWGKIPSFWVWQWLAGRYPEFTPAAIESLNRCDKAICRSLLEHEAGLKDNTEVDTRCHDKMACAQFLNKLSDERGRRLKGWLAKAFADKTKVNWKAAGCFVPIVVEEGLVRELIWAFDGEKVHRDSWVGRPRTPTPSIRPLYCVAAYGIALSKGSGGQRDRAHFDIMPKSSQLEFGSWFAFVLRCFVLFGARGCPMRYTSCSSRPLLFLATPLRFFPAGFGPCGHHHEAGLRDIPQPQGLGRLHYNRDGQGLLVELVVRRAQSQGGGDLQGRVPQGLRRQGRVYSRGVEARHLAGLGGRQRRGGHGSEKPKWGWS